jgi:hypothetical protein
MSYDHREVLNVGTRRELWAVCGEQNLNLQPVVSRHRAGGPSLKNLHEKRLMLRVQMRFWLLNKQKGYLTRM